MGLFFLPPYHVFSCLLPCLARAWRATLAARGALVIYIDVRTLKELFLCWDTPFPGLQPLKGSFLLLGDIFFSLNPTKEIASC